MVISNGAPCFPGHDVNSIADRLACAYDHPCRIFMRRAVSTFVMSEIRSGLESMHWRIEMTHQPRRLTTLELLINEELEG